MTDKEMEEVAAVLRGSLVVVEGMFEHILDGRLPSLMARLSARLVSELEKHGFKRDEAVSMALALQSSIANAAKNS